MANNILRQIEFTKTYEDIGLRAPQWQNVAEQISLTPPLNQAGVHLSYLTSIFRTCSPCRSELSIRFSNTFSRSGSA